jgi:NADPH:quinone reductase-like Zn-dependent oxidoreductase
MEQAAAIGVPFITAWAALIGAANLQIDETVLIVGAAGAVGQAAVQIANWKGARVLGAVRGSGPVRGVAAVIDTTAGNLSERVLAITGGKGADAVFDTVGGPLFEPALRSLRHRGRQIAISSTGDPRVTFNLVDFYHTEAHLIGLDSNALTAKEVGDIAEKLRPGFESGNFTPPDIEAVPFEDAVEAYQKLAAGAGGKKYVLTLPEG